MNDRWAAKLENFGKELFHKVLSGTWEGAVSQGVERLRSALSRISRDELRFVGRHERMTHE